MSALPRTERVFIVDGSNLGRRHSRESTVVRDGVPRREVLLDLAVLRDGVRALARRYPDAEIAVVIDRRDAFRRDVEISDQEAIRAAIESREFLVAPAGTRTDDHYILSLAEQYNGDVVSDDAYRNHRDRFPWLSQPGRSIGVTLHPRLGWAFNERAAPSLDPTAGTSAELVRSPVTC